MGGMKFDNHHFQKEEAILAVELAKILTKEREGRFAERVEELQTEKRELRQQVSKHHAPRFDETNFKFLVTRPLYFIPDLYFCPAVASQSIAQEIIISSQPFLAGRRRQNTSLLPPPSIVATPRQDQTLPRATKRSNKASTTQKASVYHTGLYVSVFYVLCEPQIRYYLTRAML
jgi:hypothetical protein